MVSEAMTPGEATANQEQDSCRWAYATHVPAPAYVPFQRHLNEQHLVHVIRAQ